MFRFKASYAIHEGGTKYYQVFDIYNEAGGEGVVITHWGSYTPGAPRAPKHHAKGVKVDIYYRGSSSAAALRIVRGKSKRGYGNWANYNWAYSDSFATESSLEKWFKPADISLIMSHLRGDPVGKIEESSTSLSGLQADFVMLDDPLNDVEMLAAYEAKLEKDRSVKMQDKNWGTW